MASTRYGREFVHEFPLVHLVIGMCGNITFVLGSVFFFFPSLEKPALWLFICGSCGMLLGSLGEVLVRYARRRRAFGTGTASEPTGSEPAHSVAHS